MPDITAITRDDIRFVFPCAAGSNVLVAAEEAGFYLPSVCRHGRCGTCRATVLAGRFELAPHEAALPPGLGGVLLCRCHPHEDLTIALPCRDAQVGRRSARHATLETLTPHGDGALGFTLRLRREDEHGQAAEFQPGQHMLLQIPGTAHWHALGIANLPNEEGLLEFLIPAADEAITAWRATAKRGAAVTLRGPAGKCVLDETSPRPRCLIGAGAGAAALLSMLRHLASMRDRTRLQLILQTAGDAAFLERNFAPLCATLPQLKAALVPDAAAALQDYLTEVATPDIYVSGPPPLVAAVQNLASAKNLRCYSAETRSTPA